MRNVLWHIYFYLWYGLTSATVIIDGPGGGVIRLKNKGASPSCSQSQVNLLNRDVDESIATAKGEQQEAARDVSNQRLLEALRVLGDGTAETSSKGALENMGWRMFKQLFEDPPLDTYVRIKCETETLLLPWLASSPCRDLRENREYSDKDR